MGRDAGASYRHTIMKGWRADPLRQQSLQVAECWLDENHELDGGAVTLVQLRLVELGQRLKRTAISFISRRR